MMKQSATTNGDVQRTLNAWQRAVSQEERQAKRYPVRGEARLIRECGDGDDRIGHMVQIRDISRTGAGLLCSSPIEVGERWTLQPIVGEVCLNSLPVFCRHCRKVADGVYLIGVAFGIDAATMIALGVPAGELGRDENSDGDELRGLCDFVDPSELLDDDDLT
jgi:hypothetical protein